MNPQNFVAELKRRNVIRMAGLYLVGAWLVVQVAGTVLPMFGAPEWLPRTIVVLLAIGFVPAVIFSWVFELTPDGLRRDEDVTRDRSITPQTGRRMDRTIMVVLVLALGYFAFDKFVLTPRRDAVLVTGDRAYTFVFARDFQAALRVWETTADTAADQRRRLSAKATIRALAGDFTGAQADAEKARQLLEERLRGRPGERVSMRELIWVYLALKRDADALKLARQAVELLPPERDALLGNSNLAGLAEVEACTGAASDAIAILRRLLGIPAGETVSIARLKIDPVWDPIRTDPGFQQLLAGQEHVGP